MTTVTWDGVARGYIPREPLTIDPGLARHDARSADVDPVTFEVIRYALLNANVEHGQTLQRLCVSPITMLTRDFQPSILTQDGELVFLGPYLQYFSNAQSLTIKWVLENRSAEPGIGPGDMFLSNDPYVGTPHQPDTIVAAPVFAGQQLFCWVANVLHHSDIGGSVVGSFCVDAPDIFTDPPAFPPFKIVEAGRVRTDMEQVFLRQSRLPGVVQMDLRAAISANTVTVRKIEALVSRYGADAVKTVMNKVIDAGEQLFTERLRQIPDGTWSHRVYAEASHTGDTGLYRYQLTVRKRGDELLVDNAGTDPQAGSINVTYAGLVGAFLAALTASLTPDLAGAYGGVYRRVRFDPVPGTLSCADFPAAVSPSGVFTMELLISLSGSVIAKMVACGPPELRDRALGPSQPHWYGTIIAGQYPTGAPYIAVNANNMAGSAPTRTAPISAGTSGFPRASPATSRKPSSCIRCCACTGARCRAGPTAPALTVAGAASPRRISHGARRAWRPPCMSTTPSPRRSARSGRTRAAWDGSASGMESAWPSSSPQAPSPRTWTPWRARSSRWITRDRC